MLCRVADSLFWMSRYLERAENQARFIDVTSSIALGYRGSEQALWSSLLHAGGDAEAFLQRYAAPTRENIINYLLFDRRNLNSVVSCLTAARENAERMRLNNLVFSSSPINSLNESNAPPTRFWASVRPRGLTKTHGTSHRSATSWNEPTRHHEFWTFATSCCCP